MSSNDENGAQGEYLTASIISVSSIDPDAESDEMKRAAARQLIEKYYYQLTDGCGDSDCENTSCASCDNFSLRNASRNEMAIHALDLFKKKASLCEAEVPKVARQTGCTVGDRGEPSTSKSDVTTSSSSVCPDQNSQDVDRTGQLPDTSSFVLGKNKADLHVVGKRSSESVKTAPLSHASTSSSSAQAPKEIKFLTEEKLLDIIETCKSVGSYSLLIRTIGEVYNNPESLIVSFRNKPVPKEEIRAMQVDLDKDTDDKETSSSHDCDQDELAAVRLSSDTENPCQGDSKTGGLASTSDSFDIDIESLRRAYAALMDIPDHPFQGALINALSYLSRSVDIELRYSKPLDRDPNYLNIFIMVMEIPCLHSPEFVEGAYPEFCRAMGNLPMSAQAKIARFWSHFPSDRLHQMLESLQQLITVKVINGEGRWGMPMSVGDDEGIIGAARVMKILYYACICGGQIDSEELLETEKRLCLSDDSLSDLLQGAVGREPKEPRQQKEDPLGKELRVDPINCRKPLVPFEEFVNEPLNEHIDIPTDYANYRVEDGSKFFFVNHNFLLTTASKYMTMYFDNRMRMLNERRTSWLNTIVHGAPSMPFLRLRVRRDHLLDDALVGLEMVAMENPSDLKKQLFVEFEGEQGLDEGGVSKEFFQLVVEEIFNPDFGMFTFNEETGQFWFNPTSFENDGQFTLIGIVLGLAIYNSAILDVHFPIVVYRKLMGKLGQCEDLADMDPVLSSSLFDILKYEGNVEETFLQTFCIGYHDVFGTHLQHNLKERGDEIPVTNENRKEFVDLYADFLLNKSTEKQFRAFKRGFQMVTDESPLKLLFRPEEIELLVCGNKNFDFKALEDATDYDGGFNKNSQTIRYFWEVVHEFTDEQKKKLLQFTTGTDRVPVGGLAKLKLIITRNGPDSDRLPTSHTCFNVLLLPDYLCKEKLCERLLKAITYSKGFGML